MMVNNKRNKHCHWIVKLIEWNPDFSKPPKETKIGLRNWVVLEIDSKITNNVLLRGGRRLLVWVIRSFKKLRVGEIEIPLYI